MDKRRTDTRRQPGSKPSLPGRKAAGRPSQKTPLKGNIKASAADRDSRESKAKDFTVQEPMELLPFLLKNITNAGRNSIKSMLSRGQIAVNGKAVTAFNYALQTGQTVTLSKEKVVEAPPLLGLTILHEDEHLLVVVKEAGLLSIASDKESDLTAYRQLTAHVRADGNEFNRIFVVHRLDRDTSGVMMFAKSEEVQQLLQNSWQDTVKERTYVALVEGKVKKPEGTITSWLKESKTLKMYSSHYPNDGLHAVTHYKVIQSSSSFSLLEVSLETGRKNQIRVHMEDIGHPIVNDKKYGSKSRAINRLGLHARVLSFVHPKTGALLRFETEIPKMFLNPFREGFTMR
jgi:23S rRNA pseudouridine1911/1915/1917 synthase